MKRVETEAAKVRRELYEFERDKRSSSPIYRDLITRQTKFPSLQSVQRQLLGPEDVMVIYLFGEHKAFVMALTRNSARVTPLIIAPKAAVTLGVPAGALTSTKLVDTFVTKNGDGVMQQLTNKNGEVPTAKLAALWRTLVPEPERASLISGKVKRLIVVPDGPLALLPFETLVVNGDTDLEYLLDGGPPITYAPSAAVLLNLMDRPVIPSPPDREPVLALGDPAYPQGEADQQDPAATVLQTTRSRYAIAGGKLPRLPHSATEAKWVTDNFSEAGIGAGVFLGPTATERAVRYWAPGRKVLHMACHGLADASYGNYFGALALTPGSNARTDDDGFLTLAEVCELNLKGCELAILSACQTNYGPHQKGEGTWALSRGFLVAGARRVVASNWLVDDEAAASLVSRFCGGLAQAEKAGKSVDYAASLQEAKRWVRTQQNWRSPYYWASLVLLGPS
jgi:CHAT domain-containing protein